MECSKCNETLTLDEVNDQIVIKRTSGVARVPSQNLNPHRRERHLSIVQMTMMWLRKLKWIQMMSLVHREGPRMLDKPDPQNEQSSRVRESGKGSREEVERCVLRFVKKKSKLLKRTTFIHLKNRKISH
ncbi:hypothetical protein B9Z55_002887 [Caenorhabditis nigoni]|uniref:Uncharacterized protein n=1 Tax=Caenorhabditis nigoni TaxID=1611254 RepID=A0A2G5VN48_9PELO|nr:hypothetical protein B9Z55_002887 [Caenorhabditis nigoni]